MSDKFSELSINLTKKISKKEKNKEGIFFTPMKTIKYNIDLIKKYKKDIKSILEPSCGSCEYILQINKMVDNCIITGIEKNKIIFDNIKDISKNNITLINDNFLKIKINKKYDLVLGNPPYFVIKKKEVNHKYYDYFEGRPNIFILFIIKSLEILNEGGILSFILPKNFLNSLYYNKTRQYIYKYYKILEIINCVDNYIETKQETIIFVVQNKYENNNNEQYTLKVDKYIIFGPKENISKIKLLTQNCTYLNILNLKCQVGKVVWNQDKEKLTDDNTKTRLIYSTDIINKKLEIKNYTNVQKKNYIDKVGDNKCRLIINRGYGKGAYKFNYCIVDVNFNYVLENHIISIEGCDKKMYEKIIKSFEDERTKQFIENYFGNNAINTTELNYILPIFLDKIDLNINREENKMTSIKILNEDCRKRLKKLKNNSIDCVITDPPYFLDKLDEKWDSKKVTNDSNSHIKHLPKGMKYDKRQVKNLYEFYLNISKDIFKKLKPGGFFLSFSSPRLYHSIAMACEIAGFEIRDMINWTYTQSMPKGMSVNHIIDKMKIGDEEKEKLKKEYEGFKTPMIKSCFEPICVAMKPIGKLSFIKNELQFKTGLIDFNQKVGKDNDKVPANIMTTEEFNELYDKNFLISKPSKKEKGKINTHITVKPLKLIEHLITLFSKKGSLVLDPFLGSGTTALACKNTGRNCLGIEINKEYYEIAIKRV